MKALPLLGVILAGCAVVPEVVTRPEVVEIKVEVARPCKALQKVAPVPSLTPNAELKKQDDFSFVLTVYEERARLAEWVGSASAVIQACKE